MLIRSVRLEGLFGVTLDLLTAEHIRSLVTSGVSESLDLDFKSELYGARDQDKFALAGDVAALANTNGGAIILGVEEDEHAIAIGVPGVALSDDEERRMRQLIAQQVAPFPRYDVLAVPDGANDHGFYVITVERTPAAPHAVLVNKGLRYPRRNGSTTRYLSEPEVAEAYQSRIAGIGGRQERLDQLHQAGLRKLRKDTTRAWVAISLTPDVAGAFPITEATRKEFDRLERARRPTAIPMGISTSRVHVGVGFFSSDGEGKHAEPLSSYFRYEAHNDGAGFFAMEAGAARRSDRVPSEFCFLDDEFMGITLLSGLSRLADHASSTGASGGVSVTASVYGLSAEMPGMLSHNRGFRDAYNDVQLTTDPPPARTSADLDDLQRGPGLVATVARLHSALTQAFGKAETGQFTEEGIVRLPYFIRDRQPQMQAWADHRGVTCTTTTLTDE